MDDETRTEARSLASRASAMAARLLLIGDTAGAAEMLAASVLLRMLSSPSSPSPSPPPSSDPET